LLAILPAQPGIARAALFPVSNLPAVERDRPFREMRNHKDFESTIMIVEMEIIAPKAIFTRP